MTNWLKLPCGHFLNLDRCSSVYPFTGNQDDAPFDAVKVVIPGCKDAQYVDDDARALLAYLEALVGETP